LPDGSVIQKRVFRHVRFRPYEAGTPRGFCKDNSDKR